MFTRVNRIIIGLSSFCIWNIHASATGTKKRNILIVNHTSLFSSIVYDNKKDKNLFVMAEASVHLHYTQTLEGNSAGANSSLFRYHLNVNELDNIQVQENKVLSQLSPNQRFDYIILLKSPTNGELDKLVHFLSLLLDDNGMLLTDKFLNEKTIRYYLKLFTSMDPVNFNLVNDSRLYPNNECSLNNPILTERELICYRKWDTTTPSTNKKINFIWYTYLC
jgi:hypothetical protein